MSDKVKVTTGAARVVGEWVQCEKHGPTVQVRYDANAPCPLCEAQRQNQELRGTLAQEHRVNTARLDRLEGTDWERMLAARNLEIAQLRQWKAGAIGSATLMHPIRTGPHTLEAYQAHHAAYTGGSEEYRLGADVVAAGHMAGAKRLEDDIAVLRFLLDDAENDAMCKKTRIAELEGAANRLFKAVDDESGQAVALAELRRTIATPLGGPITWTGDLADDCVAHWRGMVLHAECMGCGDCDCDGPETCRPSHGERWWWAVTRAGEELASSNESGGDVASGDEARRAAEEAASAAIGPHTLPEGDDDSP